MVLILKQTRIAYAKQKAEREKAMKEGEKGGQSGEKNTPSEALLGSSFAPSSFATPVKSRNNTNTDSYPNTSTPTPATPPSTHAVPLPSPIPPHVASSNNNNAPSPVRNVAPVFPGTPLSPQNYATPPASRIRAQQPARSVLEQLYFQCRKDGPRTLPQHLPVWVYCAEIYESTTLVVMNQGLVGLHLFFYFLFPFPFFPSFLFLPRTYTLFLSSPFPHFFLHYHRKERQRKKSGWIGRSTYSASGCARTTHNTLSRESAPTFPSSTPSTAFLGLYIIFS